MGRRTSKQLVCQQCRGYLHAFHTDFGCSLRFVSVDGGGGGNSFVGLTADAPGLGLLASTAFTNNANGTYTIKTAGMATTLVVHGVGKTALSDGTFPTYDMTVTSQSQVPTKIN